MVRRGVHRNNSKGTRLARALTLGALIALSLGSKVALGQDVSLPQIPATLPPAVLDRLTVVRAHLLDRLQVHNLKVDTFNSRCGQVQPGTALFSECTQDDQALSAEDATLIADKKGFAAQLSAAVADANPTAGAAGQLHESERLIINREIEGIQNALRQLNKSMDLDASQREEWEQESAHAEEDAWFLAGSATLDLIGVHAEEKVKAADKDLKDELKRVQSSIDEVREAYGGADYARNVVEGRDSKTELALEAVWKAGEKLKLIGPEFSLAKTYADASYLIAVQAASTKRLGALNANSEEYLAAVKVLKARMETLVKAQKALQ